MPGESSLALWGRRLVSLTLYALAACIAWGPGLTWLLVLVCVESIRDRRYPMSRAVLFFDLYLFCEWVGVIGATILWLLHAGGRRRGPAPYLADNASLQRWFTDALFYGAIAIFGMKVQLEPGDEVEVGPLLLFSRHTSTADTVLAAALFANRHGILLKYVLKRELLWDPGIDIVGRRLPNAFVQRAKDKSSADIAAVVGLASTLTADQAVLIFPEGTRFSPAKRQAALAKLAKDDHGELLALATELQHVLPPKLGGPLALLAAAPGVDVVFLEHTGFEGAESFAQFFRGGLIGRTVHARFRRVSARLIPRENRERWLFEQWRLCDQFVAAHLPSQGGTS